MRNKNTKKLTQKIISSFLALIMVFTLSTVSSIKSFAEEVLTEKVHVIVENTTYSKKDGAAWDGTLVDDWVKIEDNMTMMDAIVKALDSVGATQTGAENNYISEINGLKEFDGGSSSGWMGTKNDWFVNQGFGAFKVKANDEIRVMYTTNFGADIGGDYSKNDTSLKAIDFSKGSLSPKFSSETKEYTLTLEDTDKINVKPTATNKNYQVRVYKGEDVDTSKEGYKRSEEIKVSDGETITVICGDKSWPGSNASIKSSTYTFKIKSNIKPNTAPVPNKESDSASINLGETYLLDLSKIFRDEENDKLTYTVSVNNNEEVDADSNYSFKPEKAGNYKLEFKASDGRKASKPYILNLSVDDGKAYEIKTLDTENGQISVDVKEGKLNTKVTLTVKPNENFAMDTLEIKDKDGNDIEREINQDKSDGINYIYTFEMPASHVKVKATFGKAYTYKIEGHDWYNMFALEVYNRYGEIVKPKELVEKSWGEKYGNGFEKGYYHLTAGEYKYIFYGYEKNIGRKGTFKVEKTNEEQSKTFFPFEIYINENKLNEKDSNEVNIEITDPDGNVLDIKPGYKEETYQDYYYVLEAKGEDKKYKIKVTPVDDNVNYSFTTQNCDSSDQIYAYVSARLNGSNCTSTRTIKVYLQSKAEDPVEYRVNKGAGLHLYNTYGEAYRELFEVKPLSVDTSNKEYDSYKFQVPSNNYMLVAGGGDTEYVKTTKPYFYLDTEKVKEAITIDLVKKEDYEENPYSRYKVDDIYTNIVDEGSYVNMNVGDTQRLETFRVWQGMTSPVSNKFFEPDKNYEVIYGKECLSIEEKGGEGRKYVEMTGKKDGIAVIKFTYDSLIEGQEATNNPGFDKSNIYGFNAIDKEQTGIVIVNVGGSRGDIDPNFKVRNRDWTKYDTVYFTGDTTYPDGTVVKGKGYGEYNFTPSKGVTVETHDPIHMDSDFANNWTKYEADKNGSYTIKVKTGRNIVRMTSGDNVVYYVLDAMESDIRISNDSNKGKELKVGDKASVSFTNLEVPIYKMAAIYNPGFPDRTYLVYDLNGETIEGPHKQYSVNSPLTFTIDKKGTYKLSKGKVHAQHMGSPLNTHCSIPEEGLPPDFNAGYGDNDIYFNTMPDIEISVDDEDTSIPRAKVSVNDEKGGKATVEKISEDAENKTSKYKLTATANENYEFEGWKLKGSDEIVSTDEEYEVEIDKNTEYVANFKLSYIEDKTLRYTVLEDGNLSVKEPLDENVTEVIIPSEIEGRKVVEIGDRAFYSCQKLTKVKLSEGLKEIKARAFMTCMLLESIEIPETVEVIGQSAFAGCENMKLAKLPSKSLKTIPKSLFNGCKSLESIEIPEGITVLKDSVFTNCISLKEITLPRSLINIEYPEMVFRYCEALKMVKGYKGTYAEEFAKKYKYTFIDLDVKMPVATVSVNDEEGGKATAEKVSEDTEKGTVKYKLTAIANENYKFEGWSVKGADKIVSTDAEYEVEIDKNIEYVANFKVAYIEDKTLRYTVLEDGTLSVKEPLDENVTEVIIPSEVKGRKVVEIEDRAFYSCQKLTKVELPEGLKEIKARAFMTCILLESIEIPETVEVIGQSVFAGCEKMKSAKLPSKSLKTIPKSLFNGCKSLESIEIPEGITVLKDSVFTNCISLKEITLPRSLINIEYPEMVFRYCEALKKVKGYKGTYAEEFAKKYNYTFVDLDVKMPVAKVSVNDEKGGKATVEKLSEDAENKTSKYKLTATANENYEFEGWKLKGSDEIVSTDEEYEVEIDKNTEYVANFKLSYIEDKTLRYTVLEDGNLSVKEPLDENVTEVIIPSEIEGRKVVEIGDRAFYSCQKLTKVKLSEGLKEIKARAFMTCMLLESIEIPETVEELGQSVFAGCEKMKSAKLPSKSLKTIPKSLFNGCKSLESIEIPEGITVLKDSVFTNCVSLREITLPRSLTNIEYPEMVFRYCEALKTVKGYKGTYAEEFAKKYNYTFVDLDVKMPVAKVSVNDEKCGKATAEKVSEDAEKKTAEYKLTATANKEYIFMGWASKEDESKIISEDETYSVTISKDSEYVAIFKEEGKDPQATITVTPEKGGSAKAEMKSIDKKEETAIWTLTAKANTHYEFVGWMLKGKDKVVSTNATYEVKIDKDTEYVAKFKYVGEYPQVSLNTNEEKFGNVSFELVNQNEDDLTSQWKLIATPNKGYKFVKWVKSGDKDTILSEDTEYIVTISEDTTFIAVFEKEQSDNTDDNGPTDNDDKDDNNNNQSSDNDKDKDNNNNQSDNQDNDQSNNNTNQSTNNDNNSNSIVKTGDQSSIWLYSGICIISVCILGFVIFNRRKKR